MIPQLETERLTLRAPKERDFPVFEQILTTDRARYMGGPISADHAWAEFLGEAGSWIVQGFGPWAVEERASGAYVGSVGITKRPSFPEIELGWLIAKPFEGRGFAYEAAIAARDYGFGPLGLETLVSYIDPENALSIALAERLGARLDKEAARPEPDDLVFRHAGMRAS
ncbi:MAG: GNAT family N-acetyltransferase [Neomegalonema sp.]|nr:GNAT family N-acetyltransferase [Neomegalonema sp.]